jgi:CRISPR/Cas system endoribonuclease Cas6 (RAMP superfamily)
MAVMRTFSLSFKFDGDKKFISAARLKGFGVKTADTKICT